jgi:hypothetical protein
MEIYPLTYSRPGYGPQLFLDQQSILFVTASLKKKKGKEAGFTKTLFSGLLLAAKNNIKNFERTCEKFQECF